MNTAAINIHEQAFCRHTFSNHLGKYVGVKFIDHMVRLCSALKETAKLSLKVVIPFCIPISNE